MNNTSQQWIPLTGPGGRLPTEDDGDNNGMIWLAVPDVYMALMRHWSFTGNATAFMPIPERPIPPLPKAVEASQDEKDMAKAKELNARISARLDDVLDGIRHGRSDGRAQLARECLGLFDNSEALYQTANKLHALLTKAAEEKP